MEHHSDSRKRKEPTADPSASYTAGAMPESSAKRAKVGESSDQSTWQGTQYPQQASYTADPNAANYDYSQYYAAAAAASGAGGGYDYSAYYNSPEYYAYYYATQGGAYPQQGGQTDQAAAAQQTGAPGATAGAPGAAYPGHPGGPVDVGGIKKKKTLRVAAGEVWEDKQLADWPENDWRVFVGNLGPEVNDDQLWRAFEKYKTLQRVRVVKENGPRGKSRGYGFLSFGDAKDFLAAMKEMNGKHIGSRPVKLVKSDWKDRSLEHRKMKKKEGKAH